MTYHTASGGDDVSHSVGRGDDVSHSVGRGMTYHTASGGGKTYHTASGGGDTQRPMMCHTDNNVHTTSCINQYPYMLRMLLTEHNSAILDYAQHNIERQ